MRDPHVWVYHDFVTYRVCVCTVCGRVEVTEFPGPWVMVWQPHIQDRCPRVP